MFLDLFPVFALTSPCGKTWVQYKSEHCYKLFGRLQSYSDAEKVCKEYNSSMVSIHSGEEQNFLTDYIFTQMEALDNVWIGAKMVENKQAYKWSDNTTLTDYSNWARENPSYLSTYCVEMLAHEGSEGKWAEERCAKRNMVVCQRVPIPSIWQLSEAVIELKHTLQLTTSSLVETKNDLAQTENRLTKAEAKIAQLQKETVPIGFVYVQLPFDKRPEELWPNYTWMETSSLYKGIFFRVVGGEAATFGQVQPANAPRLESVYCNTNTVHGYSHKYTEMSIPVTGWSDGVFTGGGFGSQHFMSFKSSKISEVRPRNMAIKIYQRIA